jgi:hypothetical protein
MRRIATVGAFLGVGILMTRVVVPKLHERVMTRCEAIFERRPEKLPARKMMCGVEAVRHAA